MVGYHGITGWSGGGRRPLTYNLMPGQMRSTRVNVFQSNYIMPMATCYYAEPHCHCEDSGMPKWMQWMMGIGMGSQLLGGIMSGIFGGGGSSEGAGGVEKDPFNEAQKTKYAQIKDVYGSQCKLSVPDKDGYLYIIDKKDPKIKHKVHIDDLEAKVAELYDENSTTDPVTTTTHTYTATEADMMIAGFKAKNPSYKDLDIRYKNGKYVYNNQEFEDLSKLNDYLTENSPTTTVNTDVTDPNTAADPITTGAGDPKTVESNGKVWHQIASENYDLSGLNQSQIMEVWHAIKDATDETQFGKGAKYNSKVMPAQVKLPAIITLSNGTKVPLKST